MDLLRFITCGSVDDGKSTLIGRLLHDTGSLADDQLAALSTDSQRHGTRGGELDFALLLDGLAAEREQGITIDVAYRYFNTARRKFIVADCPGHAQYTRNMATGASNADLAIVLVDARKGLLDQTRRHSYIATLLGVRHVVLAVNKMDLVGFDKQVFDDIAGAYGDFATRLGLSGIHCIPLCALNADNLLQRSPATPWYRGPALMELLETVDVKGQAHGRGFRMPVQWVSRPDRSEPSRDVRSFAGTVVGGSVRPGDELVALPGGTRTRVARIVTADGDLPSAHAGQAITLVLAEEVDISRGDLLACAKHPPLVADQFAAHILWMDARALLPGRPYWLTIGSRTVGATITELKHRVEVETQAQLAARQLDLNEVGYCNLALDQPVPFESYRDSRALGGFILIDRQDNATVAAGMIDFALRRADNIPWQSLDVDKAARALSKQQRPRCVWFTGLSGSGKSTIANIVERRLHAAGMHTYLLDGDNVRHGLNRDLGFTDRDRVENIRRVAEVARMMVDAGLIVLVSFISPFRSERRMARALFDEDEFVEVFVDTPMELAEHRDPKGLYAKARAGHIPNFTGIDSPYERPERAELVLETAMLDPEASAGLVMERLLDFNR